MLAQGLGGLPSGFLLLLYLIGAVAALGLFAICWALVKRHPYAGSALLIGLCVLVAYLLGTHYLGRSKLLALVDGDQAIRLKSLEIAGQRRRVICTDEDVLRYFEARVRGPSIGGPSGTSYHITFRFAGGGVYTSQAFLRGDKVEIWVDWGPDTERDPPTHAFHFSEPMPRHVATLLQLLNSDNNDAPGTVLTIEGGLATTAYDASLALR